MLAFCTGLEARTSDALVQRETHLVVKRETVASISPSVPQIPSLKKSRRKKIASLNALTYCGSIGVIGAQHKLHQDNATVTVFKYVWRVTCATASF